MADATNNICTACGWLSAIISCLSFGSFAVPIKCKAARECNVDPLVFQSYKTFMCFATALIAPPILRQRYYFTPYGILSGLFWVPAAVAAIYAVQNAGLALSQGLWSSIIVLVSFVWGIFIFHEGVKSELVASVAVFLMCVGLWGMSLFSTPATEDTDRDEGLPLTQNKGKFLLRKRRLGMAAAAFNGLWGGSIMVPMHFAPSEAKGMGFIFSFAIGASIVTICLWMLRFGHAWYRTSDMVQSYNSLPSMHFKIMWAPGSVAGLLWSIGNIASMVSVQNLGEGVGYSVTQAAMLVSGLWGIFYFNEVASRTMRIKWFVSALIALFGILLLSYEHVG